MYGSYYEREEKLLWDLYASTEEIDAIHYLIQENVNVIIEEY